MAKIKNNDFIREVAKSTGFSQKDIREVMQAIEATAIPYLKNGDAVKVLPSVLLDTTALPARKGINPRNGNEIDIAASKMMKAKFSVSIKKAVQ